MFAIGNLDAVEKGLPYWLLCDSNCIYGNTSNLYSLNEDLAISFLVPDICSNCWYLIFPFDMLQSLENEAVGIINEY